MIIKPIHIHPMKWISNSKYLLFVFNWVSAIETLHGILENCINQECMLPSCILIIQLISFFFHSTLYLWKLHGWQRYGILSRGAAMPGCSPSPRGPYSALCLFLSKYFNVIFISRNRKIFMQSKAKVCGFCYCIYASINFEHRSKAGKYFLA